MAHGRRGRERCARVLARRWEKVDESERPRSLRRPRVLARRREFDKEAYGFEAAHKIGRSGALRVLVKRGKGCSRVRQGVGLGFYEDKREV
ncbi:hypothetical protein U1Q18_022764, partial [Sarracenia purpurea var. burkii]